MSEVAMSAQSIKMEFPIFNDITVLDKRETLNVFDDDGRQLEFFHPEDSPTGAYHMEVYNPQLTGAKLDRAVFGEFLHAAPALSPHYKKQRELLVQTFTPAQKEANIDAYKKAQVDHGETRPFEKWMEVSRVDAFIRGHVSKQWPDYPYNITQRRLMDEMINDLHKGKTE
jgi:hypothetical protein